MEETQTAQVPDFEKSLPITISPQELELLWKTATNFTYILSGIFEKGHAEGKIITKTINAFTGEDLPSAEVVKE